jgi:hypothetical protein
MHGAVTAPMQARDAPATGLSPAAPFLGVSLSHESPADDFVAPAFHLYSVASACGL